jgi:hypothetical protein
MGLSVGTLEEVKIPEPTRRHKERFMAPKASIYDIAEILKAQGFGVASNPFETAVRGNRVLILAPTSAAGDMAQRSYYKKLGDTQINFRAIKWRIIFEGGGRLEIYTPSTSPDSFRGLDPKTTFYSLYRG